MGHRTEIMLEADKYAYIINKKNIIGNLRGISFTTKDSMLKKIAICNFVFESNLFAKVKNHEKVLQMFLMTILHK
jgi:hypothetical protein